MNAYAPSRAVSGNYPPRRSELPRKPSMHRSRFAYLFDLSDEKERDVCRKVSYFHRGGDYTAVEFRRSIVDGERVLWAIVDTVPRWRDRWRWSVCWWNIDTARQGWHDCRSFAAAQMRLNTLTLQ